MQCIVIHIQHLFPSPMFHFLWRPAPAGLEEASFTQLYEELVATRLKDQASPGSKQNPGHGIFDTFWYLVDMFEPVWCIDVTTFWYQIDVFPWTCLMYFDVPSGYLA